MIFVIPDGPSITACHSGGNAGGSRSSASMPNERDVYGKWVSVKGKKPKDKWQTVIVTDGQQVLCGNYSEVDREWYVYKLSGVISFTVTHWMPLPSPPEPK